MPAVNHRIFRREIIHHPALTMQVMDFTLIKSNCEGFVHLLFGQFSLPGMRHLFCRRNIG